jgi:hypothetical protein
MGKFLILFVGLFLSLNAHSFQAFDGNRNLNLFNMIQCDNGVSCFRARDRLMITTGIQRQEVAAAGALSRTDCGKTYINAGAVEVSLPVAADNIGCSFTFIVANASNFDINPDDDARILPQGLGDGNRLRNATVGGVLMIQAISAGQWVAISHQGTWTDIDD